MVKRIKIISILLALLLISGCTDKPLSENTGSDISSVSVQDELTSESAEKEDRAEESSLAEEPETVSDISSTSDSENITEDFEGGLHITVLSIGKADSILIESEDQTMLIDTGEMSSWDSIHNALKDRGIAELDYLLITHFDKDHVGSAALILQNYPVKYIYYPDYIGDRDEYIAFMNEIEGNAAAQPVTEQIEIPLGGATLNLYPPEDPDQLLEAADSEIDNNLSIVTMLQYGDSRFLFCGDIEGERINEMLASDTDWNCDWIKLPHHGKYEKAIKSLIKASSPSYAIVTDSKKEPVEEKTIEALQKYEVYGWSTTAGDICTICDGTKISVKVE